MGRSRPGLRPHPSLARVEHRLEPLPARPWAMKMGWEELLFAHWPVRPEMLRDLIPAGLELELFEGEAWLGLVPFQMAGVRLRGLPPVPTTANFPELNLRTYVTHRGRPGVWFFSLDASSWLAVRGARVGFHLPYFDARMSCEQESGRIRYASERIHRGAWPARLQVEYRPTGPILESPPGSLEHFLTERYCLYASTPAGTILRGDIHHAPWPLQVAEAEFREDSMTSQIRVHREGPPRMLHYARSLDVIAWLPEVVSGP